MKALLLKDFFCAPNGHTVEKFNKGAYVEGKVAKWAVEAGIAEDREIKISDDLETKEVSPEQADAIKAVKDKLAQKPTTRRRGRPKIR